MGESTESNLSKLNMLIELARNNENIQDDLKSGDKDRVFVALKQVDLTLDDVHQIHDDLSLILAPEGWWRWIEE